MSKQFQTLDSFPKDYYSTLIQRLFERDSSLLSLYPQASPDADFELQIQNKKKFSAASRATLVEELLRQYGDLATGDVKSNILSLNEPNTFTVTTGQQIHIMLGPMYVLYKIWSTLDLAKKLQVQYPHYHFVPVFWMASEDHDKDEIDHFTLFNKNYRWDTSQKGPVGRFTTNSLAQFVQSLSQDFATDEAVLQAFSIFEKAYTNYASLADATRYLVHHFFQHQGLVCIDPDAAAFKQDFKGVMKSELEGNGFGQEIQKQTSALKSLGFKPQINPRDTNLFLFHAGNRERIDRVGEKFVLQPSLAGFDAASLLENLENHPENFSPNVALRPLYQETILPNLAYIAGPGEIAYWMQLYPIFGLAGVPAPILRLRHSFVKSNHKLADLLEKRKLSHGDLLEGIDKVKVKYINHLQGSNPLKEQQVLLQKNIEAINQGLYKAGSAGLKGLKKQADQYLKDLAKELRLMDDTLVNQPQNTSEWNKISKAILQDFNTDSPQERRLFLIETLAKSTTYAAFPGELPSLLPSPLSVVLD